MSVKRPDHPDFSDPTTVRYPCPVVMLQAKDKKKKCCKKYKKGKACKSCPKQ